MWTHKRAYVRSKLTRKSIETHARMSLYRALNVGRVIGFIGSGITAAHGRPSWSELVSDVHKEFLEKLPKPRPREIEDALETLKLIRVRTGGDSLKIQLEVMEAIAREIDAIAGRRGEAPKDHSQAFLLRQTVKNQLLKNGNTPELDPIAVIYDKLRIRRFLTLNYDLELERFLAKRGFAAVPGEHDGFGDKFEKGELCQKGELPQRQVTARDNLGRTVRSDSLVSETIGNLIAFAALPHSHESDVFHLHGRVNDPKNIILTEADYQRTYLRRTEVRGTFGEALETIFAGNEVLFLGLGMSEDDLLRPLRQFISENRAVDTEARRLFALLPFQDEATATERAIELYVSFGVQSIFYGEQAVKKKAKGLGWAQRLGRRPSKLLKARAVALTSKERSDALCASLEGITKEQAAWWHDWQQTPDERWTLFQTDNQSRIWTRHRPYRDNIDAQAVRATTPLEELRRLAHDCRPEGSTGNGRRILRVTGPRGSGKGHLFAELRSGDAGSEVFADLFHGPGTSEPAARYSRAFFAHTGFSPEFGSVLGALMRFLAQDCATDAEMDTAKAILKSETNDWRTKGVKLPGGIGNALCELWVFRDSPQAFFERHPRLLSDPASDASNSGANKPKALWGCDEHLDRLGQLRKVLSKFSHMSRTSDKRLFICFMGLDRLCDKRGIAFNPIHREFFRLLTDARLAELPIDLVLIDTDPKRTVAYLSRRIHRPVRVETRQIETRHGLEAVSTRRTQRTDKRPFLTEAEAHWSSISRLDQSTSLEPAWEPWPVLPTLPMAERHWLCRTEGPDKGQRWLSLSDISNAPALRSILEQDVALDTWVSLCARYHGERSAEQKATLTTEKFVTSLELAASRRDWREVLGVVMRSYWQGDRLDANKRGPDTPPLPQLYQSILRHLSLFSLPVQPIVLASCPEVRNLLASKQENSEWLDVLPGINKTSLDRLIKALDDLLVSRGLVIMLEPPRSKGETRESGSEPLDCQCQCRYTLHPRMREYMAMQMKFSLPDRGERNYYEVSLHAAQPRDLPTPAEAHFRLVQGVVRNLINNARDILRLAYRAEGKGEKDSDHQHLDKQPQWILHAPPQLLRGAYSILRESFSIGSLSRMGGIGLQGDEPERPYEIYRSWLRGIINAATGLTRQYGALDERLTNSRPRFRLRDAFYREEVIWLYNERGITAFTQGRMYDALPLFKKALKFTRRFKSSDDDDKVHQTTERRIQLSIAAAQIERGNIGQARTELSLLMHRDILHPAATPSVTQHLAAGYLGLCDHLSGDLRAAEAQYAKVIHFAEEAGLLRTIAVFERHAADLARSLGKHDEARSRLRRAVLCASQEEQRDVQHFALVAEAKLAADSGERGEVRNALRTLDAAERYAREMGLIKLEAITLAARAEIILNQGETEFSGQLAARAIALANLHGMRLRKLSGVILYARIIYARGQLPLARSLLNEAGNEAERRGYQLKAEYADRLLRDLFQSGTEWSAPSRD